MSFEKAAAMIDGTLYNSDQAGAVFSGVSIDSRTIRPNELFIALRGEHHDGHNYIGKAIENGAAGIIAEFEYPKLNHIPGYVPVIAVHNSHEAMLRLAAQYRLNSHARFVAITGSNGKTTTRELTYRLISAIEPHSYRSPGNLNNLFGAPLSLLRMPQDTKVAVMELGISTADEMPQLAELVQPDVIVITNVGPSHLAFLQSVEDVARAKLELVRKASPDVPVIINADDTILFTETKRIRSHPVTFAINAQADFHPDNIKPDGQGGSYVTVEQNMFHVPLPGKHQVYNLLAAYSVVRTLGYSFFEVETESLSLETEPLRGQKEIFQGITFVADCYNANPESMQAGLSAFTEIPTDGRRILILGDMLELGDAAEQYHHQIGKQLAEIPFDHAILVGPLSRWILEAAQQAGAASNHVTHVMTTDECVRVAHEILQPGDTVYLKASHGIGLETVLHSFRSKEGN